MLVYAQYPQSTLCVYDLWNKIEEETQRNNDSKENQMNAWIAIFPLYFYDMDTSFFSSFPSITRAQYRFSCHIKVIKFQSNEILAWKLHTSVFTICHHSTTRKLHFIPFTSDDTVQLNPNLSKIRALVLIVSFHSKYNNKMKTAKSMIDFCS